MQIYGTTKLALFAEEHEEARVPFNVWQLEVEEAKWTGPEDVQPRYANAIVEPDRIVFSIKDKFKIAVKVKYKRGVLLIEEAWAPIVSKMIGSSIKSAALRSKA